MIEHCEHTWWYHSSNCGVERVSFPPQLDDGIIITKRVNNIDRYCIIFSIVRRYLSGDGFTEADHKTRHCTIQIIPVKRAFPRDTLLHSFVSIRSSVIVKFSPGGSLPRSSRRRRREEFRVDPFRSRNRVKGDDCTFETGGDRWRIGFAWRVMENTIDRKFLRAERIVLCNLKKGYVCNVCIVSISVRVRIDTTEERG